MSWTVVPFVLTGYLIQGFLGAIVAVGAGYAFLLAIESWWPYEASKLEWNDIELAVHNYAMRFVPGSGGIKFICNDKIFFFEKREVFRYTKDKEFVVWYKTRKWSDVLDEQDDALFTELCGKAPVRDVDLDMNKTFLIPQQEETEVVVEVCLKLIKHFIAKSGVTLEAINAREKLFFGAIWVEQKYQEVSPVPIVPVNFKGKKDGRPVIALTDRKGYWILHEDGELEQFTDFDRWWKNAG